MDGLLAVLTMAGFNILYEKMRFRGKKRAGYLTTVQRLCL